MKKEAPIWKRLLVLFIILPAINSFIVVIHGASLLFILTSPLFEIYLDTIKFKSGLISASIGFIIIEITIWVKGLNYVFGLNTTGGSA